MTGPITVERLSFGGRTLVDSRDAGGGRLAGWPEVAREAVRAINHLTVDDPLPAPTLYRILGDLKGVGLLLPQACVQFARGLEASLDTFDVYDDRRDPADSVLDAVLLLHQAARAAAQLGELLEAAQTAIADQGYRTDEDNDGDERS